MRSPLSFDEAGREIVLTIHWKGGQHSELRLRKPQPGEHDCRTSDEALAVIAKAKLSGDAAQTFLDVVRQDAAKAGAAIRLVLAQPAIGSQIIDNLNASIHLRALLTDLFLLDETLKLTGS